MLIDHNYINRNFNNIMYMKGLLKKLLNSVNGISELDFFIPTGLAKELGIHDRIDYESRLAEEVDSQNGTLDKDEKDVNENEDESITESDSEFHDWD